MRRFSMFGSSAMICFAAVVASGAPVGSGQRASLDRVSGDTGGVAGGLECLCGVDVDNNPICFRADECPDLDSCSENAGCDPGEACNLNCCFPRLGGVCVNISSCTNFFTCDDPQACTAQDSNLSRCTPLPEGACCGPGCACRITTQLDCGSIGGTYNGDDTICDPIAQLSPEIGEVTLDDECYDTIEAAAAAAEAALIAATTDGCPKNLDFQVDATQEGCTSTIDLAVSDNCGNTTDGPTLTPTIDPDAPTVACTVPAGPVILTATECEAEIDFTATITDNCCVNADSVMVTATLASGAATIEVDVECEANHPNGDELVEVSCTFEVSNVTECPAVVQFTVTVADCCGNEVTVTCDETVEVRDETPPVITNCPEPITLPRGDHLCDTAVQDWLDTLTATDNCPGARVYDADDLDLTIPDPDVNFIGMTHTIDVPESFVIEDLNIDLDITHSRVGDLVVNIIHGSRVALVIARPGAPPSPGCEADNYNDIILDDEGALPIETQCTDDLFSPPNYIPFHPLSLFDGMDAQGTWTIHVVDGFSGETGTLGEWSLHFNGGPTLSSDAPPCGFPPGTTEVEFKATDACGNMDTCTSEITIEPFDRIDISDKGSFLAFSKIEVLWQDEKDGGQLLKDTFLDITNDYPGAVLVQGYFINGDIEIAEERDDDGNIMQEFEPGWNTADCLFQLTGNQPHFWSAANGSDKCQPFVVLDPDGRPANSRILRGYALFWAVKVKSGPTADVGYEEIRWNHLKGDAVIVDYAKGTAEEYNAWSAAVTDCVAHGEPPRDCTCRDENGTCCEAEVRPGRLDFDGFQYSSGFDELLLDFYASGSTALSGGGLTVMLDTQLTLHTLGSDLRQDGAGPILTKVEAEIWNEFESKFSGTRRCICCWDSTLLSDWARSQAIPNHFTRSALRTDKGKARLDGVESDECDYLEICGREPRILTVIEAECPPPVVAGFPNGISFSHDASLLGISTKFLSFSGRPTDESAAAAMNLVGMGLKRALIRTDTEDETDELQGAAPTTDRLKSSDRERQRGSKGGSR